MKYFFGIYFEPIYVKYLLWWRDNLKVIMGCFIFHKNHIMNDFNDFFLVFQVSWFSIARDVQRRVRPRRIISFLAKVPNYRERSNRRSSIFYVQFVFKRRLEDLH